MVEKLERVLDVRERDVHDRRVEYHHELAGRDDGERDAGMPLPAGRTWLLVLESTERLSLWVPHK